MKTPRAVGMLALLEKHAGRWGPVDDNGYQVNAKFPEGTVATVDIKDPRRRSGKQHRYWFKLAGLLYQSQEYYKDFDHFRQSLVIRLGHYTMYQTKDGPIPIAHSLKIGKMPADKFGQLVDQTLNFAEEMGLDRSLLVVEAGPQDWR